MSIVKGILKVFQRIIGIPFFVASAALFIAFFVVAAVGTIRNPEMPKNLLREANIYERASDVGVTVILGKVEKQIEDAGLEATPDDLLRGIAKADDLYAVARDIFPAEWIQGTVEGNLDDIYTFIRGESDDFVLAIDLASRQEPARQALGNIFKKKFTSLPVCDSGNFPKDLKSFNLFSATCRPEGINIQEANAFVDQGIASLVLIPEESFELPTDVAKNLEPFRKIVVAFPYALGIILGLFIFLSGIGMLLMGRRISGWLWGIMLILVGLICIAGSVTGPIAGDIVWNKFIVDKLTTVPEEGIGLIYDLFLAAIGSVFGVLLFNGIIAVVAGVVLIIIRKYINWLVALTFAFIGLLIVARSGQQLYSRGLVPPGVQEHFFAPVQQRN